MHETLLGRQGRRTNIMDGSGSRFLSYTDSGLLLTETNASGALAGLNLENRYDQFLRRTNLTLNTQPSALNYAYAYDPASRLTNVSDGTYARIRPRILSLPTVLWSIRLLSGQTARRA